jgi:hypothetical protein
MECQRREGTIEMQMPTGFSSNKPCCAIVSIAAATCADYQTVETWFRQLRRKQGRPFTGVTTSDEYLPAIRAVGKKAILRKYARRIAMRDWWARHGKADTTYLVRVGGPRSYGHMMAFRNGFVIDQHGRRLAGATEHWRRWANFVIEIID